MDTNILDKALNFLKENYEISFATCEDNKPRIRIFQIMKQEGTMLYFATSSKKGVYQQLKINPNIEILAFANKISVKCVGKVDFHVSDENQKWIYDNNPVLQRLYNDYHSLAYFKMQIELLYYYDLKPTPPIFKHYDLINNTVGDGFVGDKYSKK